MGRPRRKKGKTARRAKQGLLGISATAINQRRKRPKQFEKRVERRLAQKDESQTEELLRENVAGQSAKEAPRGPHSFVIHTGRVGRYVRQLERDLRRVMCPNTSKALKVTKRNNFKDFVVNSQFLGVSHLLVLTRTPLSINFRIIRNPQGPTLHFKVEKYSLSKDVLTAQKRPVIYEELFQHAPLVVMNGFGGGEGTEGTGGKRHLQLTQTVVQNMFPAIDVDKVKLVSIRRTLLMNYDAEQDLIEFRHYSIKAVPAGVSRSVKKLMQSKIPDLSKYEDISDFMLKPEQLSDSEFEGEQIEMQLPQDIGGRGKKRGQQTKLRLMELGPRMTLRLLKIEEGINEGEVLHHAHVKKSGKEIAQLRKTAPLSRKRRLRQEKRVEHLTIRKMKHQVEREKKAVEMDDREKRRMIGRQREVTGEYGGDSSGDDGGMADAEADDENEPDGGAANGEMDKKIRRRRENSESGQNSKTNGAIKKGTKKPLIKGKGSRFK